MADQTGQTLRKIEKDADRDFYMTTKEAKAYGLIDYILQKR
jgi:ATP-dependent Clp protease protease subunit